MERRKLWLCMGIALLLLGAVLVAALLSRDEDLHGSGIIFVERLTTKNVQQ